MSIIFYLFGLIFLSLGGVCRGIFESVTIMDTMKKHWKSRVSVNYNGYIKYLYFWSKELFEYNKDRNNDGKTSWLESTFPNDGGHRIKLAELFSYACACTSISIENIPTSYVFLYALVSPFVFWWVISFAFTISFAKYRK